MMRVLRSRPFLRQCSGNCCAGGSAGKKSASGTASWNLNFQLARRERNGHKHEAPLVLTIGQLNAYVKSLLDGDDNLNHVYVSAEISNFTNHYRTGHFYFSLKDEML